MHTCCVQWGAMGALPSWGFTEVRHYPLFYGNRDKFVWNSKNISKGHIETTVNSLQMRTVLQICIVCLLFCRVRVYYSKMYSSTLLNLFHNHFHHGCRGNLLGPSCCSLSRSSLSRSFLSLSWSSIQCYMSTRGREGDRGKEGKGRRGKEREGREGREGGKFCMCGNNCNVLYL